MPHEDGAAYYPLVATVSLNSPIVLDLYGKQGNGGCDGDAGREREPHFRILQEPRSLLITRGRIYTEYLHGIAETTRDEGLDARSVCNWDLLHDTTPFESGAYDRQTRISLTYRDVLKVSKLGNAMKFLGGR